MAERMLAFSVGERQLGLPATLVREIAPPARLSRVPHGPDALLGLANLRGIVVPVLSVARLLGEPDVETGRIIVADLDGPIGLAVSAVARLTGDEAVQDLSRLDIAALLKRAVPERRAPAAAHGLARMGEDKVADRAVEGGTHALVAFLAGGQDFALPLDSVEEVVRVPVDITVMPHADAAVVGTMALRREVLPLLSLTALLGLREGERTSAARVVVVHVGTHRVGLVVEGMKAIERVSESRIDLVPQALKRGGEAQIQAICRMDDGTRLLSVLSCDQLLREDVTARLLQTACEDDEDMESGSTVQQGERFVLFRIGQDRFALPVGEVQEIAGLPERLAPLPKAPAFVKGLMSVRGEVIPVIDQVQRFAGSAAAPSGKPRVIVVRIGSLTAGFIVDAVSELVEIPEANLREAPDLGSEEARVFDRVAQLAGSDDLVLVVDPQALLDRAERDLLTSLSAKVSKA
ncbi:chemotaxis protein CheW [Novosphingobium sp. BL-8A]|uniref:chemotaxis protein CheW n=1 Tax=Novosphingobium sp. BL-8A TaxID=3127639 RepID=UPI0037563BF2